MNDLTRARLRDLLGMRDTGGAAATRGSSRTEQGVVVEDGVIAGARGPVPYLLLTPTDRLPKGVILYGHAHGHRHDIGKAEALEGRKSLQDPPLAVALALQGHAVLAPDMPGFGDRQSEGSEAALAKAAHWQGETLLGQMLGDLEACIIALPALGLSDQPIGSVGFSMGSFLSFFLAALRPEISACAHLCGFANIGGLIAAGEHDLHAPYLTVPGLVPEGDMAAVAALIAPRPQLVVAGGLDPLTPPQALDPALRTLGAAYGGNAALRIIVDATAAHVETATARAAVLDFFAHQIGS